MSELYPIPPQLLPNYIDQVFPMIDKATEYSVGKYKGADVVKEIARGKMQLWAALEGKKINGIAITEIVTYPCTKVCRFLCCTGENAEEWFCLITEIENWAIAQGCRSFEAICRVGWEKFLKNYGYSKGHVIMHRELQ